MIYRLNSELDLRALLLKNPDLKLTEVLKPMRVVPELEQENESEDSIQARFFAWVWENQDIVPEFELVYSVPNGGGRTKSQGALLQRTGVKAGIPDVHLPVASGKYISLYIEFKTATGYLNDNQKKVIPKLRERGNFVAICRSASEGAKVLDLYLRPLYMSTGRVLPISALPLT